MKRKAKQNVWGNWYGYTGRNRTHDFGTDDVAAGYWVLTGKADHSAGWASREFAEQCRAALTQ